MDFQFDATTDGRPIKIVSIIDEHTRECLGGLVARSATSEALIDELDHLAATRGYLTFGSVTIDESMRLRGIMPGNRIEVPAQGFLVIGEAGSILVDPDTVTRRCSEPAEPSARAVVPRAARRPRSHSR